MRSMSNVISVGYRMGMAIRVIAEKEIKEVSNEIRIIRMELHKKQ